MLPELAFFFIFPLRVVPPHLQCERQQDFPCQSYYVPPTTKAGGRGGVGWGTYCFWDGVSVGVGIKLLVRSVTWIPFGIFWWYLVDQDKMTCRIQDWQLWLSYFWSYHPLFYLKKIWCPLCNSNTLWNISMVLGRNVEQDQTTCRIQEWQLCLSYFWRYLPLLFDSDNPLISYLLCKSKTLLNIFMMLGRNVEQNQTTCHVQEWQLCLSYFWRCLPLLCLTVIIHWFRVPSVSQRPFEILLWYLVEM